MIYLCCDTNIWINISNSEEPTKLLDRLHDEISNGNIKLILPEIIIKEWKRNKQKAIVKRTKDNIKSQITGLYKLASFIENEKENIFGDLNIDDEISELAKKIKSLEVELKKYKEKLSEKANDNIKLVEKIFQHNNAIILETDKESSVKVISLATEKVFPFKGNKNNFADCLLFFQYINYLEINEIENAHFVSSNKDDFFPENVLHGTYDIAIQSVKAKFHKSLGEAMNSSLGKEIVSQKEMKRIEQIASRRNKQFYESPCPNCYDEIDEDEVSAKFNAILVFEEDIQINDERRELQDPSQLDLFQKDFFASNLPLFPAKEFLFTAQCNNCSVDHYMCPECQEVFGFEELEENTIQQCSNCEIPFIFRVDRGRKGEIEGTEFVILREDMECARCGGGFTSRGDNSNLCVDCEEYYGTSN